MTRPPRVRQAPFVRAAAIAFAAVLGATALAGCGGDDGTATPTPSLPASAMATPSTAMPGSDPATWSPVLVRKGTADVTLLVGQVAIVPRLEYAKRSWLAESSDPTIAQVLDPETAQVVGFRGMAAGSAVIRVYRGTGKANDGKGKLVQEIPVTVGP